MTAQEPQRFLRYGLLAKPKRFANWSDLQRGEKKKAGRPPKKLRDESSYAFIDSGYIYNVYIYIYIFIYIYICIYIYIYIYIYVC